jgi:predicted O-linked N-acetylglucosamine transferase (SPINDLY family)
MMESIWRSLRHNPLQIQPWADLVPLYAKQGQPWAAAFAAQQACRLEPGRAAGLDPVLPPQWRQLASRDPALDPMSALPAEPSPCDWLGWLHRARLLDNGTQQHQLAPAVESARASEPIAGETLHWLGVWRLQDGNPQAAVEALKGLLDLVPQRHGSMLYLGEALLQLGHTEAAEKAFTRASHSNNPAFLRLLAERVFASNYWQEAIAILEKANDLKPADLPTLVQLAKLHWEVYDLSRAQDLCRQVLAIDAANGEIPYLLNALPGRLGDARAHFEAVQQHYTSLADPSSRLASSIAMASLYCDHLSAAELARLHRDLCAPISSSLPKPAPFHGSRDCQRRPLRIGLLSGDFHRQHPVNLFMLPLLQHLDPEQLEITVYAAGGMVDAYTRLARQAVAHWVEAAAIDDAALQHRIIDDRIDILLDLAGHTGSHRLGVLALRAAPVQATFLGYPHSTGLESIDWLIGDPIVSPASHTHLFSEGIAQLPNSVFCWAPIDPYPLPPPRPPEAPVIFGSFNNVMKLSPSTITVWAEILAALPDSLLLLKAPSLRDGGVQQRFRDLFADKGIRPERLHLEGPSGLGEMMDAYGQIDIALDPFPYNGGTTSLQALWMGVPLIALQGHNFVSRMGASFLTSLGRPEWIANDPFAYRRIAIGLAAQVQSLRNQRAEFRDNLISSPLGNIEAYSRDFEQLLKTLWQSYAQGTGSSLIALPSAPIAT